MISQAQFRDLLWKVYSPDFGLSSLGLEEILAPVPRVDALSLPLGARVLVRCDMDVPFKDGVVQDLSRLESLVETIQHCVRKSWTPIIFGHLGRDPQETLAPVRAALEKLLGAKITFIPDWIDSSGHTLTQEAKATIAGLAPGQIAMLENTRKYDIERVMWKIKADAFESVIPALYSLAKDLRESVATTLVNEALAASNFDFSSAVLPLVMDQVAYGFYIDAELRRHVTGAREATLIVFSGLKIDKLDDLEDAIDRGVLRYIIAAGSLAMALKRAGALIDGGDFHLGIAQDDETAKTFIPLKRIEQARRLIEKCRNKSVRVILPVDFVLQDGSVSDNIGPGKAQMDIGPKSRELFAAALRDFAGSSKSPALFHNGVFGKFEDQRFEEGTRSFMHELAQATKRGVRTYIGGGEGRMALLKYGELSDVTHAFTAGGTILKSLGDKHIAYVKANYVASVSK